MKHYDGKMIRLEQLGKDEMPEPDKDKGIQIKYKELEFTFFPGVIVSNKKGQPIFGIKFNYKERLALYWKSPDVDKKDASKIDEALQILIPAVERGNFGISDIMDYLPEIYDTAMKVRKGEIELKDGPHPGWKQDNVKTTKKDNR